MSSSPLSRTSDGAVRTLWAFLTLGKARETEGRVFLIFFHHLPDETTIRTKRQEARGCCLVHSIHELLLAVHISALFIEREDPELSE
jgi:hypothetical protein